MKSCHLLNTFGILLLGAMERYLADCQEAAMFLNVDLSVRTKMSLARS